MAGKEHTIFKSLLFLTLEEENDWKKSIVECLNDCSIRDEEEQEYSIDDYIVTERFYEDIWEDYDCQKANLNKTLPNNIIAIGTVGRWNGTFNGGKVFGNNLNEILYAGDCDDINVYCDRYDVHSILAHHDGRHYMTYRMLKDGVDGEELLDKLIYGGGLSQRDITRYTTSLRPYIKDIYGWK